MIGLLYRASLELELSTFFDTVNFFHIKLPIQIRDGELEDGREGDPEEVRDVGVYNPRVGGSAGLNVELETERIECIERPDERREDQQDVHGGEIVILQPELQVREREIENEVERKRQSDHPRQRARGGAVEDGTESNGDNRVQHRPHGAEDPRRWRPEGLQERLIRGVGHTSQCTTGAV